jgi:hypothetical protein
MKSVFAGALDTLSCLAEGVNKELKNMGGSSSPFAKALPYFFGIE